MLKGPFDLPDGAFEDLLERSRFLRVGVGELFQELDTGQLVNDIPHLPGIVGDFADPAR
ncbi:MULTISPECIES: hypothetical protein [unclassified Bradyrhizobium]|uniref:hypothetical protein n=2 Tax=Bradyrhizobium TaxID=374 RepID=UPI001FF794D8|nr:MULTISPECIES: hypothetical protein [unclassified Bradyrhizobium]